MTLFDDLEDAFERGREVGRREGLLFRGLPHVSPLSIGAEFRFERSWIDSFIRYERVITEQLRELQRWRWIKRGAGTDSGRDAALEQLQRLVLEELRAVRDAVDAELATGRGRACVVEAMRRAPNRPKGILEYPDVKTFVAEDPRRAIPDWPHRQDAGGADYGANWRLENPIRRWETTRWRMSWLCMGEPTHELYAIERRDARLGAGGPAFGRVWLLGMLTEAEAVEAATDELQFHAQSERNSLLVVAEAVRRAVDAQGS